MKIFRATTQERVNAARPGVVEAAQPAEIDARTHQHTFADSQPVRGHRQRRAAATGPRTRQTLGHSLGTTYTLVQLQIFITRSCGATGGRSSLQQPAAA
jgi:hypothetical protein